MHPVPVVTGVPLSTQLVQPRLLARPLRFGLAVEVAPVVRAIGDDLIDVQGPDFSLIRSPSADTAGDRPTRSQSHGLGSADG